MQTFDGILDNFYEETWHLDLPSNNYAVAKEEAKQAIQQMITEIIGDAEPCEPDCTEVRHAFHEGAYQLTIKQRLRAKERGLAPKEENAEI